MGTGPGQAISAAVRWAQEWQRLSLTATNQAMGHYLNGYANVAMARTPQQALAALHKTQTGLLRHSAAMFADAIRLLRRQNAELLVMRAAHARAPNKPAAKLRTIRSQ
jgi:hypothetical protein